jgi:hypothetical protein
MMSTPPDYWDDTDYLTHINRIIGPTGRIVRRSRGEEEKREFGDYYIYDYRQDAVWGEDCIDLRKYYAELLAHPPRDIRTVAAEKGWPIVTTEEVMDELMKARATHPMSYDIRDEQEEIGDVQNMIARVLDENEVSETTTMMVLLYMLAQTLVSNATSTDALQKNLDAACDAIRRLTEEITSARPSAGNN